MSNEAFVALMDEAYNFIVSGYLDRMLETSVSALNMNKNYGDREETDFKKWAAELYRSYFKKWAAELYRAWLAGGKEALDAAIENREQMEGENE
jgi:hypothetical protein